MLVSKMYRLVSVKYQLKITKVEIWVNQYSTNKTNTYPIFNRYNRFFIKLIFSIG